MSEPFGNTNLIASSRTVILSREESTKSACAWFEKNVQSLIYYAEKGTDEW